MQLNDEVNCFRNRSFTFHLYITKGHRIYIRTNPGRLLRATWVCSYVYSNIPLFFPLPNEIRPKRRFPLRVRDSRCTARLNTKQQPGHLPSQRPHDLQPFFIPKNILRHPAMNRIPILGSNHRHPINGKILIDLIKSSTGSPAAAAYHRCSGFSRQPTAASIKHPVEKRSQRPRCGCIVNRRAKNKTVRRSCFFQKAIDSILTETLSRFCAGTAGDTACQRLIAHPKFLCFDSLFLQNVRYLP